ncbi:hypothetical protein RJT34_21698 [Clitoria ternatea]|uniref:MADS-box domain-containing protein n=1 Tax=Clitoria ternatea TaxID=43366 RepID=A0AAN9IUV2_CLITE
MSSISRVSKGRRKIEMKKMTKESNLQVTFSKRRSGLFKKASELCTLCGAEVGLIVFSPRDKVFSFGHPSIDTVVNRYLTRTLPYASRDTIQLMEANMRELNLRGLNVQLTKFTNQLDMENKRAEELKQLQKVVEALISLEKT